MSTITPIPPLPIPVPQPLPPVPPAITRTTITTPAGITTSTPTTATATATTTTSPSPSSTTTTSSAPATTSSASSQTSVFFSTSRSTSTTPGPVTPTTNVAVPPTLSTDTTIVIETSSARPISPTAQTNASTSFFQNKGAVAGLFTVLGLIGVAIIIALVTNAIRRRRALKFDRDVAAAAAEAARAPVILDDDYNDHYYDQFGSHGGAGQPFSNGSLGGYDNPRKPIDYPMAELADATSATQSYAPYGSAAAVAGAAGVGAAMTREKSLRRLPDSYGRQGGSVMPHAAMYDSSGGLQSRRSGNDFDSTTYAESSPSSYHNRDQSLGTDHSRSRSTGGHSSAGLYNPHNSQDGFNGRLSSQENYAAQYQRGYQPEGYKTVSSPFADAAAAVIAPAAVDPYGGYVEGKHTQPPSRRQSTPLPNPYSNSPRPSSSIPPAAVQRFPDDRVRNSYRDEEDYEMQRGNRVLKVANE